MILSGRISIKNTLNTSVSQIFLQTEIMRTNRTNRTNPILVAGERDLTESCMQVYYKRFIVLASSKFTDGNNRNIICLSKLSKDNKLLYSFNNASVITMH